MTNERTLLDEIRSEQPIAADALWQFIVDLRRLTGNPCRGLPASREDFDAQLAKLVAGREVSVEGNVVSLRVRKAEKVLFDANA